MVFAATVAATAATRVEAATAVVATMAAAATATPRVTLRLAVVLEVVGMVPGMGDSCKLGACRSGIPCLCKMHCKVQGLVKRREKKSRNR